MLINNPFEHFFPENLSPKDIHDLFVKEYTEHNALTAYKHTIVEGSRGSGKSMLLRFLEPACQVIDHEGWDNFIKSGAFIGIYINCNTGDYRKREFEELLKSPYVPSVIAEKIIVHEFIIRIAEWVLKTITEQLIDRIKEGEKDIDEIISSLDKKGLYSDTDKYPKTLNGLKKILANEREMVRNSISVFLDRYALPNNSLEYEGNNTEVSFEENSFLFVLFNVMRRMLALPDTIPFFLLFDEAGDLMLLPIQQKVINTFITQRIQRIACVKVSVRPESYSTDVDLYGKQIQYIHDYDKSNLDSLYTNNTQAYYRRIVELSNKRLALAGFKITNIQELIPEREYEINKMKEAEEYTAKEYEDLPEDKKIEDKQNYINKYARARFFQKFLIKTPYWYTGFDNLVHFSAGITRSFLDPCCEMVERYIQKHPEIGMKDIKSIPAEIQWETIRDFSNNFVEKELIERIRRRSSDSEERKVLQSLFSLIESLGGAFKIRLQNINSRYPRIISFSIKENRISDPDLEVVLKKALQECFFQRRWYRGKSGYEMLECYILNRRLCPRYGLDLSGFQGRIELSPDDLQLAMKDTPKFIKRFKAKEKAVETEEIIQLDLFGV